MTTPPTYATWSVWPAGTYLHYLQYLVISTIYLRQVPGPGAAGDHRAQLRGPGAEAGAGGRGGAGGVDRLRHPRKGVDLPRHLRIHHEVRFRLECEIEVHPKVRNHGYYRFHI